MLCLPSTCRARGHWHQVNFTPWSKGVWGAPFWWETNFLGDQPADMGEHWLQEQCLLEAASECWRGERFLPPWLWSTELVWHGLPDDADLWSKRTFLDLPLQRVWQREGSRERELLNDESHYLLSPKGCLLGKENGFCWWLSIVPSQKDENGHRWWCRDRKWASCLFVGVGTVGIGVCDETNTVFVIVLRILWMLFSRRDGLDF